MVADVSIIVETNAKEVGNEFTGMASQILATKAKAEKLARAFKFLDQAKNSGKIGAQQYSKAVSQLDRAEDQLYASVGKANTVVKAQSVVMDQASAATTRASGTMSQAAVRAQQMAAAQRMAGKSTNKFGLISQQVGYQVGDFFVQVQSGTDALVAFGQQGTQLAGLLPGLAGAILGIGLSLGTAMLKTSLAAKGLRIDFKAVFKDLKEAVEPIQPLIDAIGSAFSYMGQVAVKVFQALIDNLDRVVAYTIAFAALLTGKLVAGFVASGAAASAFFALLKRALISTGIGAIVVALGEVILLLTKAYEKTGSLGGAFSFLGKIFQTAWDGILKSIPLLKDAFAAVADVVKGLWSGMLGYLAQETAIFLGQFGRKIADVPGLGGAAEKLNQMSADFSATSLGRFAQSDALVRGGTSRLGDVSGKVAENFTELGGLISSLKSGEGGIDTSDWLALDTDTKDSKGGVKTFLELLDKLRGEATNQEKLIGLYGERKEALKQIISFEGELKRKLTENEALKVVQAAQEKFRIEERGQLLETMTSNIKSAFVSVVDGSKSVVDAFRGMLRNIILAVYEQKVAEPAANAIGSLIDKGIAAIFSANGNVFNQGMHVKAYADGGVVNRTTAFPMRGGVGIMGEAGPEAIMPLKRGKNGKLGVQMEDSGGGGVTIHQNFNFSANGDDSVKRIIRGEIPRITEATKAAVVDAKRRGGSYGRSF